MPDKRRALQPVAARSTTDDPWRRARPGSTWVLRVTLLASILIASVVTPAPGEAATGALRRYPYLTDLVDGRVTINWATTTSVNGAIVRYGRVRRDCRGDTVPAHGTMIEVGTQTETQWRASLSHLRHSARYCYRIYGDGVDLLGGDPSPRFFPQITPTSRKPFSFAVLGDWGVVGADGRNPHQAAVLQQIAKSGARFVVMTGDTGYPDGSQRNYGDLVQTGADTSAVFGPAFWPHVGASIPAFVALGNHGLNPTVLTNWPEHHAVAASDGRFRMDNICCVNGTAANTYPSAWYAFDAGRARFYVLDASWPNSNIGNGSMYKNDHDAHWTRTSAEYRWLRNDLRTHHRRLSFAFFHFPLYADNANEGSDPFLNGTKRLEGLLGRHGVDVVFNGHAHIYERNARSMPGMPIAYVTGGGGAKLSPVSGCSGIDRYAIGWTYSGDHGTACGSAPTPTSVDQVFHFLLVGVNGHDVTVTPTDATGRTFDVHTYSR